MSKKLFRLEGNVMGGAILGARLAFLADPGGVTIGAILGAFLALLGTFLTDK
jgi:hypothetical protein